MHAKHNTRAKTIIVGDMEESARSRTHRPASFAFRVQLFVTQVFPQKMSTSFLFSPHAKHTLAHRHQI